MAQAWKKGRGKLGPLQPLIGRWQAQAEQNGAPMLVTREYAAFGDGWVRLDCAWSMGAPKASAKLTDKQRAAMQAYAGRTYRETAFFGPGEDGMLDFWSFTNDGKKSQGRLADAPDAPHALCFEAQMDAGLARQLFWLDDEIGFRWAVEARRKAGWSRFTEQHYRPAS